MTNNIAGWGLPHVFPNHSEMWPEHLRPREIEIWVMARNIPGGHKHFSVYLKSDRGMGHAWSSFSLWDALLAGWHNLQDEERRNGMIERAWRDAAKKEANQ